jgi:ATPase subunit of ABC transporter with duplicated ATPase domains
MPPSSLSATLVARQLSHELAGHTVLDRVSLAVAPGTCLGVVGPNGVGKSTLLQILAGLIVPTSGSVQLDPPSATVGYLAQEHLVQPQETVREALSRRTGVTEAESELAEAAADLVTGTAEATDHYALALARYESLSAGDFEARLAGTVVDLGLGLEVLDSPVHTLSGGQEAKVALSAIVLSRYDITLLDEPTNDLDFDGLDRSPRIPRRRPSGLDGHRLARPGVPRRHGERRVGT